MRTAIIFKQWIRSRRQPTPWRWPPVRSFTFANALRLLIGLWVLNAPQLAPQLSAGDVANQNQLIAGGCIVILAAMRILFVREASVFRWAQLIAGLWIISSPWAFDYISKDAAFWNSAICGGLITLLAAWSLVR